MRFLTRILGALWPRSEKSVPPPASHPCEALAEVAVALAGVRGDASVDDVLRLTVRSARHITGAAAALALVDGDGRLERLLTEGADGCTQDTLARPELLGPLVSRLRRLGRPLGPDDLEGSAGRALSALAPRGFLVLPVGEAASAALVLLEPAGGAARDGQVVEAAALLATLAGAALDGVLHASALRESREELRRLVVDSLAMRERERRQISHRLHEDICQHLAAANAQLQALDPLLDGQAPAARERLRDARLLVNWTLGELRELAQDLGPPMLDDFGYVQALRWYAARLRERHGVALSVEVEGTDARLPLDRERALYRATEEALGAFAHERGRLRVRVRRAPATVRVEISGSSPPGLTLLAMRERLRPFGGDVRVRKESGAATVVEMSLPSPLN